MSQRTIVSENVSTFEISNFLEETSESTKNSNNYVLDTNETIETKSQNPRRTLKVENENRSSKDDDDPPDISCGLGRLRTNIFGTRFANLYVFAICFALANFFTSMVEQVITIQLTSLERQFNIDNVQAGLFQTASSVGFLSTVLFAGHFAKKSNIPLIIGTFGIIQGAVLTIPAIMQFVDPYELQILSPSKNDKSSNVSHLGDDAKYMCVSQTKGTMDQEIVNENSTEVKKIQFYVVLAVEAFKGITDTFHSGFLPTLFMDDNVLDKSKMGIYLGIGQIISELSGPIGKQINGILTKVPIDLKDTDMDPKDKRFVSAWWLAFLIFGLGTAVFSFPILLFPRTLISNRQRKEATANAMLTFAGGEVDDEVAEVVEEEKEAAPTGIRVSNGQIEATDLSVSKRTRYSVRNPQARNDSRKGSRRRRSSGESRFSGSRRSSLFPAVVGPTERKVSIAGDLVFEQPIKSPNKEESLKDMLKDFPKALLRVLRKPVFVLLLIDVAIVSVPISGTSMFRNAFMANEYNVDMSEVALVSGITTALGHIIGTIISSAISSRVKTKMGYMYIITSTYCFTLLTTPFYFIIDCPNEVVYGANGEFGRPVNNSDCDCDNKQQLITCGTDGLNYLSPCYAGCTDVDGKLFTPCSGFNNTSNITLTPGLCSTDCHTHFILYAIIHGGQSLFAAMARIPRRLLILRIVDPEDRGFATSLFMFFFVFMAIPSPNLFGKLIDNTCLIFDGNFCSLYDREKIRYLMSGIDIGVHGCVQITLFIMMGIVKWEERKERKQEQKEKKREKKERKQEQKERKREQKESAKEKETHSNAEITEL